MKDILKIIAVIIFLALGVAATNHLGKECGMSNALLFSKYTQTMYMFGQCENGHFK